MPDRDIVLSKKFVNGKRKIETEAYIARGSREQWKYKMIIHLGKYSLRRYAKGSELKDCVPSANSLDWLDIDVKNKTIEIRLK